MNSGIDRSRTDVASGGGERERDETCNPHTIAYDGESLEGRVASYLDSLTSYPDRRVGGPGNRAATELFAETVASFGFKALCTEFDCVDWEYGNAWLDVNTERFDLNVGPYSLPCNLEAELVVVDSTDALEDERVRGAIVLLVGEIAAGQVMPRHFTFYNPEEHRRVYRAIDAYQPAALIAATGTNPEMVGGQHPFPLFEDGDLDVPNSYLTDVEGHRLATYEGRRVRLRVDSTRIPARAEHIVALKPGSVPGRVVVSAHIDSRQGSPGALDNATGVATLLGLADLLSDYENGPSVELVPFNGEDNYTNPGELMWIAENDGRLADIVLGINIDDSSWCEHTQNVSFYGVSAQLERMVSDHVAERPDFGVGPQWFQGDHAILAQSGVPAIAIASSHMEQFMAEYAHTEHDARELADPRLVAETAGLVRAIIGSLASR